VSGNWEDRAPWTHPKGPAFCAAGGRHWFTHYGAVGDRAEVCQHCRVPRSAALAAQKELAKNRRAKKLLEARKPAREK
jgi:hypothetical protein